MQPLPFKDLMKILVKSNIPSKSHSHEDPIQPFKYHLDPICHPYVWPLFGASHRNPPGSRGISPSASTLLGTAAAGSRRASARRAAAVVTEATGGAAATTAARVAVPRWATKQQAASVKMGCWGCWSCWSWYLTENLIKKLDPLKTDLATEISWSSLKFMIFRWKWMEMVTSSGLMLEGEETTSIGTKAKDPRMDWAFFCES